MIWRTTFNTEDIVFEAVIATAVLIWSWRMYKITRTIRKGKEIRVWFWGLFGLACCQVAVVMDLMNEFFRYPHLLKTLKSIIYASNVT